MTARSFRVRLLTTRGQYFSSPYYQNRGIPQGGVLSPLMRIVLINQVLGQMISRMRKVAPGYDLEKDLLIQLFADDIPAMIIADDEEEVVRIAYELVQILEEVLRKLGLKLSPPKRNNFIIKTR